VDLLGATVVAAWGSMATTSTPAEFLDTGIDYQIELQASAANGNRPFT
jgi:hypothetical protein